MLQQGSHMPSPAPRLPRNVSQRAAIGIDLGTSNSAVATIDNGAAVMLHTDNGTTIPSLLAYDTHGKLQAVGREVDAAHCFYSIKRLIGLSFEDAQHRTGDRLLYDLVPGVDGSAWLSLGNAPPLDVVDATAHLLQYITRAACDQLGIEQPEAVVIGVPAHFDDQRRQATLHAAARAGLHNVQLLQGIAVMRRLSTTQQHPTTHLHPTHHQSIYRARGSGVGVRRHLCHPPRNGARV